jgi:hypothetical protein
MSGRGLVEHSDGTRCCYKSDDADLPPPQVVVPRVVLHTQHSLSGVDLLDRQQGISLKQVKVRHIAIVL